MSKIYLVFISRRFSNQNSQLNDSLKGVFDNPESATECYDYYNKGLEKQSPYVMEIKEVTLESEWRSPNVR